MKRLLNNRFGTIFSKNLTARLVSYFFLILLLVVILISFYSYDRAKEEIAQSRLEYLQRTVALKKDELNYWLVQQVQKIRFLVAMDDVRYNAQRIQRLGTEPAERARAFTNLQSQFDRTISVFPDIQSIEFLSHVGGEVLLATDRRRQKEYRVKDTYYLEGRKGEYIHGVYPNPRTGLPALIIAAPVTDPSGKELWGVLAAHVNLDRMDDIMQLDSDLEGRMETYLVDQYNVFVSVRRSSEKQFLRGVHSFGIDSAIRGREGFSLYQNYENVPVLGAYTWIEPLSVALLTEIPQTTAFASAQDLAASIVIVGSIAAIFLAVGVFLLSRRIAKPILAIEHTARKVAAGDLGARAPVLTDDEVGFLARSFNEMTEQLIERESLLKGIIDNSTAVIVVKRLDGRYLHVNKEFERLMQMSGEQVTSKTDFDLFPQATAKLFHDHDRKVHETKEPLVTEESVQFVNGVRTYVTIKFPLLDPSGIPYATCGISTDITDRRDAEEAKRKLENQLLQSQKLEALGTLAGGIAHDFNNILFALLGYTEIIRLRLPKDDPLQKYVDHLFKACDRGKDIVQHILAFSRKQEPQRKVAQLHAVLLDGLHLIKATIPSSIEMKILLPEKSPNVLVDPVQIHQVLMNLCTNAAHAIGYEGGTITISQSVLQVDQVLASTNRDLHQGMYIVFTVMDSGHGMTQETVSRIFEPFFTTKRPGQGTGLGLSVVYGIIKSHDGAITVRSNPGSGSEFSVYIPAYEGEEQRSEEIPEKILPKGKGERVLFVDDEEQLSEAVKGVLETLQYQPVCFRHPHEALAYVQSHTSAVDVVITDLTMPGMTGMMLAAKILEHAPSIPVILITGYEQLVDRQKVKETGIRTVLFKPFTAEVLATALRDVLGHS